MASHYCYEHDHHTPPLPSTILAPSQHSHSSYNRHKVSPSSPLSVDRFSPPDSGRLKQNYNHDLNYRDPRMHGGKHPKLQTAFLQHHLTQEPVQTIRNKAVKRHNANNQKNPSQLYNTLTWRMDPAESLSDFKLIVIGISDNNDINRRTTLNSSSQKRRQKWNVEGLFLDMSGSEDERGDCTNPADKAQRSYNNTTSKYSNYPAQHEYHLHKVNLAVGPRSCEYFANLFQRQRRRQTKDYDDCQHWIELPLSCLPAFPVMLDYIYASSSHDQVHATTETAVSLRYLGTIFGNRSLFNSATDFIHNDLRPETAITYLLHADLYHQKKLRNVCVQICAEEFDQINIRHLAMIPPRLLENILYSKHFNCSDDYAVCSKIAAYCRCQETNIDGNMLLALTDITVMPEIYPEEALFFIKTMIALGIDLNNDSGEYQHQSNARNLYERCVGATPPIVHEVLDSFCHGGSPGQHLALDDLRVSNIHTRQNKLVCADYRQLPPQVKVDLLEYALAKRQNDVEYSI